MLDGVIRANTARMTAATKGRACTTTATGTTTRVVSLNFASWNQIRQWLNRLDVLRRAA
jgi:hypothetical protein